MSRRITHRAALEEPYTLGEESRGNKVEEAGRDYQEDLDRCEVASSDNFVRMLPASITRTASLLVHDDSYQGTRNQAYNDG